MSVTFQVADAHRHNADSDTLETEVYDCFLCQDDPHPSCRECHGTGEVKFSCLPEHETLNMAVGNYSTLASGLGLPDPRMEGYGEISPDDLDSLLNCYDPALGVRNTRTEGGENKVTTIEFGLLPVQIKRYIRKLRDICTVARSRDKNVCWC